MQHLICGNYEMADSVRVRLMQYLIYERAESAFYAISNHIFRSGVNEWCDTIFEISDKEYNWYFRDIDHSIKSVSFTRDINKDEVFLHAYRKPCGDDPNYAIGYILTDFEDINEAVSKYRSNEYIEFFFANKICNNSITLIDDDGSEKQIEYIGVSGCYNNGDLVLVEEPTVIRLPHLGECFASELNLYS